MRSGRIVAAGVAFALTFGALAQVSAANPKAGAACSKAGKKQVFAGKTFTCVKKKGKALVWNKGVKVVAAPLPTPSPISTPSPIPSPSVESTPKPSPTPTPTPTESVTLNLPFPTFKSSSFRASTLYLVVDVHDSAKGAFVRINSLGIGKKDSMTPKDANGRVRIVLEIKKELTERYYDIQFFAYADGAESPCCSGITINSGIPPRENEPTLTFGSPEINRYINPPQLTGAPTTNLSDSADFEDLSACRLPDGDPQLTNMTVGFPIPQGRVDFTKKTVVQILPVSFPDVPANGNPRVDYDNGISGMKAFWEMQSFVGTEIEVRSPTFYKQLPNSVLSYGLSSSLNGFQSENYRAFVRYVVGLYDAEINFSGVATIVVVMPPETTMNQVGTWVVDTQSLFTTNEGSIFNYMLTGSGDRKNESAMWIHEYGHALGLTDMRFVDRQNPTIQRPEGLGVFDIMGSGGAAPETLLWSRFLLNVLAPKQILCISKSGTSTHWIRPLVEKSKTLKGLIIPTGTYTALVVESRRSYGFDSMLSPRDQGVLVYRVDTRIPYLRSPMQLIQPTRSIDKEWYTDSALRLNEFVQADGWKISVIETGSFGDVVRVEKL